MNDAELLDELTAIRRRTQRDLNCGAWRWLLLWAGIFAGFVLTLAVPMLHPVAHWYWSAAVPLGLAGTVLVDLLNPETDRRVRRADWPYVATTVGITIANVAGSLLLPGAWVLVWIWIVFALGFAVLLRLEGEPRSARALVALAGVYGVVAPLTRDALSTSVVFGAVFVVALLLGAALGKLQETT
ncbi:MAG: hypothetical protein WD532_11975 [Acidimicrobiia bacterium]